MKKTLLSLAIAGIVCFGPAFSPVTARAAQTAPANLKTVKLTIKGMHCEGCASRVSRYLKKERGVTACTVNLETGIAEVTFNPGKATEKRLIAAVKKAGYTAVVQS